MKTKKFKKTLCAVLGTMLTISSACALSACNSDSQSSGASEDTADFTSAESTADEAKTAVEALEDLGIDTASLSISPNIYYDEDNEVGFQLEMPNEGDTIAVIHTTLGDITLRVFPDQAPKTVTNFLTLAKEGKYDNTFFDRAVKNFIIQGGDCGTSSYGSEFEDEFCDKLFNIRGAVSMSNNGYDDNSSQFFINQKSALSFENDGGWEALETQWENIKTQFVNYNGTNLLNSFIQQNCEFCYNTEIVPDSVRQLYETNGGNAYLDGAYNAVDRGHTVFAQVIDGMDVVDAISNVEVDENEQPVEDVIIETVEVTTYSSENTDNADETDE